MTQDKGWSLESRALQTEDGHILIKSCKDNNYTEFGFLMLTGESPLFDD